MWWVSLRDVARSGDFLTLDLFGTPVTKCAISMGNYEPCRTCATHRHCLLTHEACGHSPRMVCQYHGWEYDYDGRTGKIPSPKNFTPFDRERDRLPIYRVDTCGQLVFVSLAPQGPSLREHLGDMYETSRRALWQCLAGKLALAPQYAAIWKIPVEITLEAYHVPFGPSANLS